ncbi:hypothetical protein BDA96_06G123500 [Sorghum bicolor]|uniref:Uncharacterized protein n=2 Tax=Sorghum bicolor TaxID=4558 RepID=A0A921UBQ9_SORBI|nr:uncharacterized protein LOC8057498 [Sorghum bicolor]KAG0526182.1 hypothetical protein BDA96_06G123500 [Sorghum bicolor]KXG26500.1 hypothetical protein SORBI_3006G111500 [Sorghum bicolor]|eukprot:XP_021319508.1 uncharacterized protein LOC8057498 [Sorghum bicolor]
MGGRRSFFCIFSFSRKSRRYTVDEDEAIESWPEVPPARLRKVRSSDEDNGWWVGERDVDQKAADFIATFHQRRRLVV